jgi:hypothetical protein
VLLVRALRGAGRRTLRAAAAGCRFRVACFVVHVTAKRDGGASVEALVLILLIGLTIVGGRWGHDSRVAGRQLP